MDMSRVETILVSDRGCKAVIQRLRGKCVETPLVVSAWTRSRYAPMLSVRKIGVWRSELNMLYNIGAQSKFKLK
jgi:hypothetical protein